MNNLSLVVAVAIAMLGSLLAAPANATLMVNFGPSGLAAESGFTPVVLADSVSGVQGPFTVDGIDITVVETGAGDLRAINRGNPGNYNGTLGNLTDTWIASEDISANLRIVLAGLETGIYDWTSYHFDELNQTGDMTIRVSVDGGSTFNTVSTTFDIWGFNDQGTPASVSDFSFSTQLNIVSGQDVHIQFLPNTDSASTQFTLINGFSVIEVLPTIPEPCTMTLATFGLVGFVFMRRRRQR